MVSLLNEILNMTKDLECVLKIECFSHPYNTPILVFQQGKLRLVVVTNSKKDNSFVREVLINIDQALKLLKLQEYINATFIYKQDIYRYYHTNNLIPRFQQDLEEFIKNIKDKVLENV
jgi:hypothetical protein